MRTFKEFPKSKIDSDDELDWIEQLDILNRFDNIIRLSQNTDIIKFCQNYASF